MIIHDKSRNAYFRIVYYGTVCARLQDNHGRNRCISIYALNKLIHEQ